MPPPGNTIEVRRVYVTTSDIKVLTAIHDLLVLHDEQGHASYLAQMIEDCQASPQSHEEAWRPTVRDQSHKQLVPEEKEPVHV